MTPSSLRATCTTGAEEELYFRRETVGFEPYTPPHTSMPLARHMVVVEQINFSFSFFLFCRLFSFFLFLLLRPFGPPGRPGKAGRAGMHYARPSYGQASQAQPFGPPTCLCTAFFFEKNTPYAALWAEFRLFFFEKIPPMRDFWDFFLSFFLEIMDY